MNSKLTDQAYWAQKSPEERVAALKSFLQEPDSWGTIPVYASAVNNRLYQWSRKTSVVVKIVFCFTALVASGVFLNKNNYPIDWVYGVALALYLLNEFVAYLVARFYFRPLRLRKIDAWKNEFVKWFMMRVKPEEVPEQLLDWLFEENSWMFRESRKHFAEELLQNRGADHEEVYLSLRLRHYGFRRAAELECRKFEWCLP